MEKADIGRGGGGGGDGERRLAKKDLRQNSLELEKEKKVLKSFQKDFNVRERSMEREGEKADLYFFVCPAALPHQENYARR